LRPTGYYKLGNEPKARMAFERAQELDPNCVGALVGQVSIFKPFGQKVFGQIF
jgi:hypothetical protein